MTYNVSMTVELDKLQDARDSGGNLVRVHIETINQQYLAQDVPQVGDYILVYSDVLSRTFRAKVNSRTWNLSATTSPDAWVHTDYTGDMINAFITADVLV